MKNKTNVTNSKKNKFKNRVNNIKEKIVTRIKSFRNNKITYSFEEILIVMLFSLGLGFFACFSFVKVFSDGRNYFTLTKDLEKVINTYYAIIDNYYGDLDKDSLIEGAVNGMVSIIGDEYTIYSDSNQANNFLESVSGIYEGIGCTISNNVDGQIVVISVFENSPSAKAGLKVDDIILKLDGIDYSYKTSTQMADYIKNNEKSEIKLMIKRDDEEFELELKRSSVEMPTVTEKTYELNSKKIGYINISLFTSVTSEQFKKVIKNLENNGIDSLVIDVRSNSGGYLSVVTNIANMLLEKDKIIYSLKDENGISEIKDTTKEKRTYPIAVLINKGSASASEILASVIKESYINGYVVGTNSYGKGTVQQTMKLEDGSMIKYTVQNWLTPNGNWINSVGVEPTNIVEMDDIYYETFSPEDDNQLQKALEIVSN